jgi:hypothetical protein
MKTVVDIAVVLIAIIVLVAGGLYVYSKYAETRMDYDDLTGEGELIHLFLGGECCWLEVDEYNGAYDRLEIDDFEVHDVHDSDLISGNVRIPGCSQCQWEPLELEEE